MYTFLIRVYIFFAIKFLMVYNYNGVDNMAKKKKRKSESDSKAKFSSELIGLILVLVGIIGIGSFGPVGHMIKSFSIFLMGTWWAIFMLLTIILGLYMIIKGDLPSFVNGRLIGIYLLLIALLSLSHINYVSDGELIKSNSIFQNTIDNFMNTVSDENFINLSQTGGGILGAFFSWGFVSLFDLIGTYIILGVFAFFGFIMSINVSLGTVFKNIIKVFRGLGDGVKSSNVLSMSDDEEDEEDDDDDDEIAPVRTREEPSKEVIITSSNDLNKYHSDAYEDKKEEVNQGIDTTGISIGNGEYHLPSLDILNPPVKAKKVNNTEFLNTTRVALEKVLKDFQIVGKVVEIHEGPAVTQFEVEIKAGTKVNRITSISKEIALALAAKDVRIEAPIPGKSAIGIEVPNLKTDPVSFREVVDTDIVRKKRCEMIHYRNNRKINQQDEPKYYFFIFIQKSLHNSPIFRILIFRPGNRRTSDFRQ